MNRALPLLLALALATPLAAAPPASREVLSRVPADVPRAALAAHLKGDVVVEALVAPTGVVDSVRAQGDPRLRGAAEAAVRWWIFSPAATSDWVRVNVAIDGTVGDEPLNPDVLAMARDAEKTGDLRGAIDAWTGALHRAGRHPSIRNEWAIRGHVIQLAARMKTPPPPPHAAQVHAEGARIKQDRTLARSLHADLVTIFDASLLDAPWWSEAYQWRAASEAGCGRITDAMRSLLAFRLGTSDSTNQALADSALAGLAASDTLGVSELLKKQGAHFNWSEN